MVKIKINILSKGAKGMTFGEYKIALKKIKDNPLNHGYSKDEVEEILSFEKELEAFSKGVSENIANMNKTINDGFKALVKSMDFYFNTSTGQLKHLIAKGWYISPIVFSEINLGKLVEITKEENVSEFEDYIIKNFEKRVIKIIDGLIISLPERKEIFKEMQQLYKKKNYFAFINLCYSQTDGVSNDIWGTGFFDTDRKKDYSLKLISLLEFEPETISDKISQQLQQPKNEITNDSKNYSSIDKRFSYNRHLVMHGHSFSYGTKKNSIRAILLLEFVDWLSKQNKKTPQASGL
jgi:hypothetical protein